MEYILTVNERGQIILQEDVRERVDIKPRDKLALISWEKRGSMYCLAYMKTENLSGMIKEVQTPLMNDNGG